MSQRLNHVLGESGKGLMVEERCGIRLRYDLALFNGQSWSQLRSSKV